MSNISNELRTRANEIDDFVKGIDGEIDNSNAITMEDYLIMYRKCGARSEESCDGVECSDCRYDIPPDVYDSIWQFDMAVKRVISTECC